MHKDGKKVTKLHHTYIKGSEKNAIVQNMDTFLCVTTIAVQKGAGLVTGRIHINTRVLKHVYDKRPAQEYDFLIESLHLVARYPDIVYENRGGKRGDYCFIKTIGDIKCLCALEYLEDEEQKNRMQITTFFTLQKDGYLNNYKPLWSWGNDEPHRSMFDSGESQPNNTPQ